MIDPLDLTEISSTDLKALHEALREVALIPNRAALDILAVLEKEMLRRHEPSNISDYSDDEINQALAVLVTVIDETRSRGIDDGHAAVKFCLLNVTALVDELEKRNLIHELQ
jgi:hypothetical protein